jgi:guanylate kinase
MAKNVLVISGPTGCGESTITNELISRNAGRFVRLVTATTRAPRGTEQNGVDYHFLSKEEFLAAEARGDILEKGYIPNRDTYYGTYKPDLDQKLAQGMQVIANVQIVGTKYFKEHYNATTIFIKPKDLSELEGRLRARNPDLPDEEIMKRIQNAADEIADEGPFYDYHVVNANGKLEEAIQEVSGILSKEGYL